jgi:phage terminase small subunit
MSDTDQSRPAGQTEHKGGKGTGKPKRGVYANLRAGHQAFVCAYLKHFNASRAAIEAGYTDKDPYSAGATLLSNSQIKAAIAEQMPIIGISPERIKNAFAEIAFGQDLADIEDVFQGRSLKELRKAGMPTHLLHKIKLTRRLKVSDTETGPRGGKVWEPVEDVAIEVQDRLHALDSLARVYAMFKDSLRIDDTPEDLDKADEAEAKVAARVQAMSEAKAH